MPPIPDRVVWRIAHAGGEVFALLNVLFRQANGKTLTAPEMQELIDRADSGKLKKARERLAQPAEPDMQPKGKS